MQGLQKLAVFTVCAFLGFITPFARAADWYAGVWDSTVYIDGLHPRTIAVRIEIVDADTQIPVKDATVRLHGKYWEEWVGREFPADELGAPLEPQEREFELRATTQEDGVIVFALGWHKEWPWQSYFGMPGSTPRDSQWIGAVDDIEKVQRIEIRHPRYHYREIPLNFRHLTEFGQRKWSDMQDPALFRQFEEAWTNEIKRRDVRFFILDLPEEFPDFRNEKSKRSEFFEKVRNEDWGTIYRDLNSVIGWNWPPTKCGPYFAYVLHRIELRGSAQEIQIISTASEGRGTTNHQASESSGSARQWACPACGHIYHGESAPRFCPDCGRRWGASQVIPLPPGHSSDDLDTSEFLAGQTTPLRLEMAGLNDLSLPSLDEIRNDPAKLAALVQKTGKLKNQLAIGGLRALPMVDPDTGHMTTLDAYARNLAAQADVAGSLGEDPVATAYMMLVDSNFLIDEARIVRVNDGRYVTLTEAIGIAAEDSGSGLDPDVLRRVLRTAATARQASRLAEGELLGKALTSLPFAVSELNALGFGPKSFDGPSVSKDDALYCPELSMSLRTLTPELASQLGLHTGAQGAVIVQIDPNPPPGHDDLAPGMVIYQWGHRERIVDAETLAQKAREMVSAPAVIRGSGRDQALLYVWKWTGTAWRSDREIVWVVRKEERAIAEGPAKSKVLDLGNGVRMEFVLISAGTFYMGSEASEAGRDNDEGPIRRVQITRPFYLGKYEVTQDQYMAVMGRNPSHFSGRNLPVEMVSWEEAVAFCKKIGGRLPTEAEWEYACRAGSTSRFCFGNSDSALKDYAWYADNSGKRTHAVGQKKPNAWGLYDMHGNVWEWCSDWYVDNYRNASTTNPTGPSSGTYRVVRGGSWNGNARYCRSAGRGNYTPDVRGNFSGFRVALDSN